jgi:hypothetical protein
MKLGKMIGMSALSLTLLGLGACGTSQSAQPVSKQTTGSGSGSSISKKDKNSSDTNATQDTSSQSTSDSGQSSKSGGSDQSNNSQSSTSTQSSSSSTTHHLKPRTPPKTQKEALADIDFALNTRVPVMLPTAVPVSQGKYLTGTTYSETWYYLARLYETARPAFINSKAASLGKPIAVVEGTEYKDEATAKANITGYTKVDASQSPNMDLGHGITAIENAGMGHTYIIWNEGRWCINIDSPNDPAYKNKTYPDSKKLAQNIVTYLNRNALPSPKSIGVVTVNNWNQSYLTTVTWQYHQMTYKVTSKDPFVALKVAVAMHSMSK